MRFIYILQSGKLACLSHWCTKNITLSSIISRLRPRNKFFIVMVLSDINHPSCFKRKQQSLYSQGCQQSVFFQSRKAWKRRISKKKSMLGAGGFQEWQGLPLEWWARPGSDQDQTIALSKEQDRQTDTRDISRQQTAPCKKEVHYRFRGRIGQNIQRHPIGVHQIIILACWGCSNKTVTWFLKWVFDFYFCFDVIGISKMMISCSDLKMKNLKWSNEEFSEIEQNILSWVNKIFYADTNQFFFVSIFWFSWNTQ